MGKHSARWNWNLAPTLALTAIVSCGVAGAAVGQAFVRPSLEFGTSAHPNAAGGGQAGAVERAAPRAPAPDGGSRTARDPHPQPVRDLPTTTPPARVGTAPATESAASSSPEPTGTHTPSPVGDVQVTRGCKERPE